MYVKPEQSNALQKPQITTHHKPRTLWLLLILYSDYLPLNSSLWEQGWEHHISWKSFALLNMDNFPLQTDIQRTVKGWAEKKVAVYPTWKNKTKQNNNKKKKSKSPHHKTIWAKNVTWKSNRATWKLVWTQWKKEEGGVVNTAISKSHGSEEETPWDTRANIGVLSTRLSICSQY